MEKPRLCVTFREAAEIEGEEYMCAANCQLLQRPAHKGACYHQRVKDPELKWWHVRWRLAGRKIFRFTIITGKIAGLLCAVALIAWSAFYLMQPWLVSQYLAKSDPALCTTPIRLSNTVTVEASLLSSHIDPDGIRFSTPNRAAVINKKFGQTTLVQFPNGMLRFLGPLREKDSSVFLLAQHNRDAKKLLSPEMLHSEYALLQAALSATPDQVKWWRFRSAQNKRIELLLYLKFSALTQNLPLHAAPVRPLYTISSGGFRGFQFGEPDRPPYNAYIDLFDNAGRHFAFEVTGHRSHGPVLTQEELNAMVSSIRLTSDR